MQPDELLANFAVRVFQPLGLGALLVTLLVEELHREGKIPTHGFDEYSLTLVFPGFGQIDLEVLCDLRDGW